MNPRAASSKSAVSENGSARSIAACCATTVLDASFGTSLVTDWVMCRAPFSSGFSLAALILCSRWMRREIRRVRDRPTRRSLHSEYLPQMHLIGTVADSQQASPRQRLMDRAVIGSTHRAVHLHGAIRDPLQHRGDRDLDQRYVAPGPMMAGLVEPPCATIRQQASLLEFDAGFRDPALHGVVLIDGATECGPFGRSHHHQLDQQFTKSDRAHAMMDACRAQANLGHFEALALLAKQVRSGHSNVVEGKFADRRDVILTPHPAQRPHQTHTRRIHRHDDAGMPAGPLCFRTMRKLQRGCAAPVMNHLRPLTT